MLKTAQIEAPAAGASAKATRPAGATVPCYHCGTGCRSGVWEHSGHSFCCQGCQTVFELLTANGLTDFYQLTDSAGVRITGPVPEGRYNFLDEAIVRARLVDYSDDKLTRITFQIPAIHCIACVWLLENLFRLQPGLGESRVDFPRKEVALSFNPAQVKLSQVVTLLASLGYEPELKLSALDAPARPRISRRLWIQLAFAGFAFGNIMLFSISAYLGLDAFAGPGFRKMVGAISLLLSLPVVTYSALDYWRAAVISLRQRLLNIDVPIAAGIAAIFLQSMFEVATGRGDGYFDSLCGLIFFLLCGRLFQQKTYDRLAFDRDYKSFFPISVTRKAGEQEEHVALAQLAVGDHLIIRHGELLPADARLLTGAALVDYSFVTGESEPVAKQVGEHLYAGGRQTSGAIEVEMVKVVSQSYLTSLWNQEAFGKDKGATLNALTNAYSQRFTRLVLAISIAAAVYWAFVNPAVALKAFTSVLIVACPCALALAAPFALGTAQRVLGRRQIFLKSPYVLETLARVDTVVFDKTGTLTATGTSAVHWQGDDLSDSEQSLLYSLTRHSTHPLPVRIGQAISTGHAAFPVRSFRETPGCGMSGVVAGREIWMGLKVWLESQQSGDQPASLDENDGMPSPGSTVHVAIDGKYRGHFILVSTLRPEMTDLIGKLRPGTEIALLSGDNDRERVQFENLLGCDGTVRFNQSPLAKLNFIKHRQTTGGTVMMVGDGLNDAGALKQSDIGVAVVENVSAFSPASDIIIAADKVARLAEVLRYAKSCTRTVRTAFLISAVYNLVGIAIAASGRLSPVVCAILMPLSSITVVGFACAATTWLGRHLDGPATPSAKVKSSAATLSLLPIPSEAQL